MKAVRMADDGTQPSDPAGEAGPPPGVPAVVPGAVADAAFRLLDQLAECVLVVRPMTGPRGELLDFVIDHVNPGYADPAGRPARALVGQSLRVAYPRGWAGGAAGAGSAGTTLFETAAAVLADGMPWHFPGVFAKPAGAAAAAARDGADGGHAADLRAAPFAGRVVFTWRRRHAARDALAQTRDLLADSEQRAAEEHEFAVRLQRAIMPSGHRPVAAAGVDIAVRYRPAEAGSLVAGDWYDTLELPGGDLLLVVGDIAGHGIDAVTGMVAARNGLRGLAVTGASPSGLISHLNVGFCNYTEGVTGTVICCRYSPRSRVLRWARAGHLPPVLVRDESARTLPLPDGILLGIDPDAGYTEAETQLRPDDTLLLYTDGLIERRAASISDALADLTAAAVPAGPDADGTASRILARAGSDTGDDACLVAVRIL